MALLVHIQDGCGLFAGFVDEFGANGVIRALARGFLYGLVVQHFVIAADPHAAIGGNMALEVAVGDKDAAHPRGGWIVRGLHVVRGAPCAVICGRIHIVISDLNPPRGLTTANNHLARIREVPHDLLGALRVIVVFSLSAPCNPYRLLRR